MEKKQFNAIVLSGTIVRCVESDIQSLENEESMSIPISREFLFNDFVGKNATFLKCTCNSFYFFLIYKEGDHLYIDMFGLTKNSRQPISKLQEQVQLLTDQKEKIDVDKIESRNIDLFCSDNYLFCSIKYENSRYIYFLVIKHVDENTMKLEERRFDNGKEDEAIIHNFQILGKAYDFAGNNRNFAFFNFGGLNNENNENFENKIYTFSFPNWECQKIELLKPDYDLNFYHQNYIKMALKDDELFLIGENQKSVRRICNLADPNICCSLKYSNPGSTELISSVFTVEGHDPIIILNKPNKPNKKNEPNGQSGIICDALEFCNDQIIKHKKNYVCDHHNQKIEYIEDIQLPIIYKAREHSEQWIKSKRSCIFHSSAYLEKVEITDKILSDDFSGDVFKKKIDQLKNKNKE